MMIALQLLLAHLVGDFVLQPAAWVKHKQEHKIASKYLYIHVLVHLVLMLVLTQFDASYWPVIGLIAASHFVIDAAKLYLQAWRKSRWWFSIDQALHIGIILICTPLHEIIAWHQLWDQAAIELYLALVVVSYVASVVIKVILKPLQPTPNSPDQSLANAGKYIGILERLLVFVFVVTGHWGAVGFVFAAKSVFRFGDLSKGKDRQLTEYILIGTLLSFGWAMAVGMGYVQWGMGLFN